MRSSQAHTHFCSLHSVGQPIIFFRNKVYFVWVSSISSRKHGLAVLDQSVPRNVLEFLPGPTELSLVSSPRMHHFSELQEEGMTREENNVLRGSGTGTSHVGTSLKEKHRNLKRNMIRSVLIYFLWQLRALRRQSRMDSPACGATRVIPSRPSYSSSASNVRDSGPRSMVLGPEASASLGNLLEWQILWCHPTHDSWCRNPRGGAQLSVLLLALQVVLMTQVWEPLVNDNVNCFIFLFSQFYFCIHICLTITEFLGQFQATEEPWSVVYIV